MKKESTLSLVERIYQKLRLDIYSSKIHQGAMLTEQEIADSFNVSRTPVREALRKLEQEGLITIIPKKGSIVKQITLQDILEMDQIRELLEPYVAREKGCVAACFHKILQRSLSMSLKICRRNSP